MQPSTTRPLRLWQAISRIPSLRAPKFLWQAELADQWHVYQPWLIPTSELAAWTLARDGVTTCEVIAHSGGVLVGVNRTHGEAFEVQREDQTVCRLNLRSLAAHLVQTLDGRIDYSAPSADATVFRLGRLPPKLKSVPVYFSVCGEADRLLNVATALAGPTQVVLLVPTLARIDLDIDFLAERFKTVIVALDDLIVGCDGQWVCQPQMLDELRHRLGISDVTELNTFRLEGENYFVRFQGKGFSLSSSVGLWYLREFLSQPNQIFDPVELEAARTGVSARSSTSSTGEVFDAEARRQYARQLAEIDEEISEAESFNDLGRLEQLQIERQQILDHVSKATRKGGKARVATDAAKARKNIRQQVNRDIERISRCNPDLAAHLKTAFQADAMCYRPDHDPVWQF